MAQAVAIGARRRTDNGKGAARQLRLGGQIPAVIYGHGREPESLTLVESDLEHALKGLEVGSAVFDLDVEGSPVKAVVREIQRHPFKAKILHVDFLEIHAGEKLTIQLAIHLVGSPEGVRNGAGVLDQVMREVTIRVLPKDIPTRLDLDVTDLRVGQSLHVSDVTIADAEILTDPKKTICTVVAPKIEAEPVAAEGVEGVEGEESTEPELIRKPKAGDEDEGSED
ncbi:MAG: 50S ribosomal protein L25 [Gemmatimonadota bacterium]|nr:50S ribosomal protein L25 [Gemmatimonadota bacterium]MDH4350315.1 50S ribosomal protein L25 [Gemmatimonadota bacterium]